ncbi:MAG: HAD-IIIA family hydrolase [Candidatus Marinimicrobia bacterium]|nr:HAD-IIIA family hydrolase [Candidatus Neomarinimicrobiota bacterium]MDP6789496.1 HAD-IIIA family hydrolase [Candidatus Neomarinimicrobiota bacterium]MDP7071276.1 HAD-IIIA family hydrolase [Candidatus Neomarinimicrobiota bacterium]
MSDLRSSLSKIRMVITDVDGVLTDGSIYKGPDGLELKRFNISDGAGAAIAQAAKLKIAIISGRHSEATAQRAKELKIEDVYNGSLNKVGPYEELKSKYSLSDENIAYIGDDLIDIPVMELAGIPIAVSNALKPVKNAAVYVTETAGGDGAFREAVTWILKETDSYEKALESLRKIIDQS